MTDTTTITQDETVNEKATFTLLLVDDESNILSSLKRLFRPQGYQVFTATSGQEGLALLEKEAVDLIVSDMRMPGMTGAQFLTQARENWPNTSRILLTGYADISSTVEAINAGEIQRYISKPWDDREMLLVVRQALERRQLELDKIRLEALTQTQNEQLKALNVGLEAKVAERTAELNSAHEKLKASFLTSIKLFSNLIELRAGTLAGHSRRVAEHARRIGQNMNLPTGEIQDLFFAALLHDIGKIGFTDTLITKPFNSLNPDERHEVVKHSAKGEALLMGLEELRGAAKLIRHHHERFDGLGFPDKLSGIAIPIGARILAVANDFDAFQQGMISIRRATSEEALEYLHAGRGKRYDPQVLDAFYSATKTAPKQEILKGFELTSDKIEPGMALARDLITRDGVLLLAKEYILDENLIDQIRKFELSEGYRFKIQILDRKR